MENRIARDIHYLAGTGGGQKKKEEFEKIGRERWIGDGGGGKESVIAMTSRETPNTCFIFVRHSPLPLPLLRSKNGEFVFRSN